MKHVIKVTQQDIDSGTRSMSTICPIALALRRHLKLNYGYVEVEPYKQNSKEAHINIYNDNDAYSVKRIALPFEANDFAVCYDKGEFVEPFEFELEI